MRTIRIKLYKFEDLQGYAKTEAINNEVKKFRNWFCINTPNTFTELENEKHLAAKRLIAYQYEFLQDGTKYDF